jgi:hypothetical protein
MDILSDVASVLHFRTYQIRKIKAISSCQIMKYRFMDEMTKITNSNQSHKSYRKCNSENGRTLTSEYIGGGIRCHGGVSVLC